MGRGYVCEEVCQGGDMSVGGYVKKGGMLGRGYEKG